MKIYAKEFWSVKEEDGYIKVYRGDEVICAGVLGEEKRLHNLEFMRDDYQKNNRTRQKAMKVLQEQGYK